MAPDLKFVNLVHPGDIRQQKKLQTEIRRHVMKDIGKQRRRTPVKEKAASTRKKKSPRQDDEGKLPSEPPEWPWTCELSSDSSSPERSLAPLGSFPMEGDQRTLELVNFAQNGPAVYVPFQKIWFDLSMTDSGAFRVTLGNAADFRRRVGADERLEDGLEIDRYYDLSLGQLRQRLVDPLQSTTEATIANILGHICLNSRYKDWTSWRVHMNGLQLIHNARRGFHDLAYNTTVMILVHDLNGSIVFDSPPQFPVPDYLNGLGHSLQGASPLLQALLLRLQRPLFRDAVTALTLVSAVASKVNLNSYSHTFWTRDVDALTLIGPCIHFLLSMQRLPQGSDAGPDSGDLVASEMVRLSGLLLMARLRELFTTSMNEGVGLNASFDRLMASHGYPANNEYNDLRLWAVATVALLRGRGGERQALVRYLQDHMEDISRESADSVLALVKEIIWMDVLESPFADELAEDLAQASE